MGESVVCDPSADLLFKECSPRLTGSHALSVHENTEEIDEDILEFATCMFPDARTQSVS